MSDKIKSEGPATPDFAACAAGLSDALRKIEGGFATMGEAHFQEVAKEALTRWGYFPPKLPPDWLAREDDIRSNFMDALAKVMALTNYGEEVRSYQARVVAAENRVQELLRVIAGYEAEQTAAKESA